MTTTGDKRPKNAELLHLSMTHCIQVECERCKHALEIIATPMPAPGHTAIIVAPCDQCRGPRTHEEVQREREQAEDLKGNPAYCDGYRHGLDWVLDPTIPHMNEGL